MSSKFVFEKDVLSSCASSHEECTRLKRIFVEQSCWKELLDIQKCQMASFPLCIKERDSHVKCLQNVSAEIERKTANQK